MKYLNEISLDTFVRRAGEEGEEREERHCKKVNVVSLF